MGIDADMFNSPEWMSEALRIGNTGLWAIEVDEENGKHRMTANETMLLLLGLETHPSPEDCFRHWYGRVDEAYRAAVDECVGKMLSTGQRYEVQYPWLHPVCGRIFVRCGGKLLPGRSKNGLLRLKGYHQDVSELESMRERLRENLSRFETACRIGRIGVFECTRGSRILFPPTTFFRAVRHPRRHGVFFRVQRIMEPHSAGLPEAGAGSAAPILMEAGAVPNVLRSNCWTRKRVRGGSISSVNSRGTAMPSGRLATSPTSPSTSSMRLPCAWPPRQRRPPTGPSHPSSPT